MPSKDFYQAPHLLDRQLPIFNLQSKIPKLSKVAVWVIGGFFISRVCKVGHKVELIQDFCPLKTLSCSLANSTRTPT